MSYELRDRQVDADQYFYREADIPKEVKSYVPAVDLDQLLGDVTLVQLRKIFREVMRRQEEKIDRCGVSSVRSRKKKYRFRTSFVCGDLCKDT